VFTDGNHDLGFLLDGVFLRNPRAYIWSKIIWEMTYRLRDDAPGTTNFEKGALLVKSIQETYYRSSWSWFGSAIFTN
jgi:hypothetical protein